MLQKNENENAGENWGQGLEPKRQKSMDLDNSKILNRQELLHKRSRKKWASRSGNISTEATIFLFITRVVEEQRNPRLEQQSIGNFF
jgi:hypothetical protein